jgi:hypothetical protein
VVEVDDIVSDQRVVRLSDQAFLARTALVDRVSVTLRLARSSSRYLDMPPA